jgi:hypothetical protein
LTDQANPNRATSCARVRRFEANQRGKSPGTAPDGSPMVPPPKRQPIRPHTITTIALIAVVLVLIGLTGAMALTMRG